MAGVVASIGQGMVDPVTGECYVCVPTDAVENQPFEFEVDGQMYNTPCPRGMAGRIITVKLPKAPAPSAATVTPKAPEKVGTDKRKQKGEKEENKENEQALLQKK